MTDTVFTIGHSIHPKDRFICLLLGHGITALCDVRSKPYSRINPQFDREELKSSLSGCGIAYAFLGKELGARTEDLQCYANGKVPYDRLARTGLFRHGLKRVRKGIKKYRLALMCAEREPLECHRTILIGRHFVALGIEVKHIHADGAVETQSEALTRLTQILNLPESAAETAKRSHRLRSAIDIPILIAKVAIPTGRYARSGNNVSE